MSQDLTSKEYICPNCKTKITSSKPLTYCVCGGKYETPVERLIREAYSYPKDIFKGIFIKDLEKKSE